MRLPLHTCAVLVAAAVVAVVVSAQPAGPPRPLKRVLAIHGGSESFPGNTMYDATISPVLSADPAFEVEYYAEFLENEEFGDLAETSLRDYIREKYRDRPLDVVIANTAPAVQFALRFRAELFPGVPIVFLASTPPAEVLRHEVPGVTGMLRDPSQTETLGFALKLQPDTTRVHVVAYAPAVDGYQEGVRAALERASRGVTLTYANEPTLPETLETIRHLPAHSVVFFTRYSSTAGGVILPDEAIRRIVEVSPVPVYNNSETNIGSGVLGGMMRSEVKAAVRLGEITRQILQGAKPENIPIEAVSMTPIVDWREVQRWRINPAALPPGVEIRFREPTVWELYGSYIIATIVVVIAQLLLILELLRQRTRLQGAENTIRAREASLRTSYDRIRNMAGRLINAQETARADIARDLHDDVSQKLAYVSIGVNSLRSATGDIQDPQTQHMFDELERETRNTFEGIRRLSHDLHPATLRLLGLAPALRSHCNEVAKRQAVEVQFSSSENVDTVHPDVAVCFFRIAQESLRNGITHGGAKHLTVTLTRTADRLELTVVDDGQGFDVTEARSGGGLGLVTMEERINLVGGDFSVTSEVGRGTTVRVRGPLTPAQPLGQR